MSDLLSIDSNQIHSLWQKLAEELLNIFDAHGVCAVVANETAVFAQKASKSRQKFLRRLAGPGGLVQFGGQLLPTAVAPHHRILPGRQLPTPPQPPDQAGQHT